MESTQGKAPGFTPGGIRFDGCGLNDGDGRQWFTGRRTDWDSETFKAIGTLAAAAPDLLAALREAVESMSAPFVLPSNMTTAEHFALIVTRARAALAKAEGREA